ncbi:uncharacterized protein Z518_09138 [Rhinocladiella mackenziei CBS 650.93]|uniref:Uncharacterized protein n=1 Tax=Rhinocladiella mackenziei CBS 650.93 TaxID=1442369 RepID=A0A0D2FHC2_9EURO|nr:uncharacterized protein Z518_09138 [Rhinocladiella mackenziei CBS 650.93]KIX01412.1 hypothetical protein Z518_09138 [Rhinocladiella mackenziei CBS 650.93]
MNSERAKKFLRECRPSTWVIAGFFFHDRGSSIQKLVQGFLCEVLCQILKQDKSAVELVPPNIRTQLVKEDGKMGFAIHHYCDSDIRAFTADRLRPEIGQDLAEQSPMLDVLITDVVEKAQEVFLWARLVEELLAGISDGYLLEELRDLLATMPSEPEDLYVRTLNQTRSGSTQMLAKQKYGTYVMLPRHPSTTLSNFPGSSKQLCSSLGIGDLWYLGFPGHG